MAYVKPRIRVRENDRFIHRGCWYDAQIGRHIFQVTGDETVVLQVDYTDILDGATITASLAEDGVDGTPSVSAGVVSITCTSVTGYGDLDLTTTFSDGRIRQDFIRLCDPYSSSRVDYLPETIA